VTDTPLGDAAYARQATVLWRWVDAPQDAVVMAFVREYTQAADPALVRSRLTEFDFYTLMTFARRCALGALRSKSPETALAAFDALSAIQLDVVDWRDVVVASSLVAYAGRRVGLDSEAVLTGAVRRAEPAVADLLRGAATSDAGSGGYQELRTASGPVLIDGSVQGAVALLKRAIKIAEVIEADGRYEVTDIGVGRDLPAVWLGDAPEVEAARRRLRRCVTLHARLPDSRAHMVLVFLVQAEEDRHAQTVASAARSQEPHEAVQLGIAVGRLCAVVVARSGVLGVPCIEDGRSFARFTAPVTAALE
jgi:hypothetical protein